ncbi:hypothetical protein BDY24DRAFT_391671 [Mrakia frigida]|uniref:uncharacterized protein n=1 Tax=Mrakia frigida TaxID=29902 RepID=UPI003FCC0609
MPCLLFRSSSSSSDSGTTLSRTPSVLDLPFLSPPKRVRFPCPFASPELFASTHTTYSQAEYDRTPIEPPSEEERSCTLPGRGERCFDSDGEERSCQDEDDGTEGAGAGRDDGEEVFWEDGQEDEGSDAVEDRESGGRNMFRCWTLDAEDDEEEGGEVEEEGETSDDHREGSFFSLSTIPAAPRSSSERTRNELGPSGSDDSNSLHVLAAPSTLLLRHSASPSSSKRQPPTPGPTRRPSSSCSPTAARRLQWLQTQTESLPTALRDRLLLLASSTSSSPPPSSSVLGSPASPMSLASMSSSSPPNHFSIFSFAARSPPDSEIEDGGDDDAEERTIHSSTPRPASSFPVSLLTDSRRSFQPSTVSDDSEYFPTSSSFPIAISTTSTPPYHRPRHSLHREDSECSSTGSRTTDEIEGFFYSPDCSSASSASDWGMDEGFSTADTSLVASDDGGAVAEWEGLGKELGEIAGGFRVSRWASGGQDRSVGSS